MEMRGKPGGERLTVDQARLAATLLEQAGWRAEMVPLSLTMHALALVEVRDLSIRCHPLVATLRYPGEAERWLKGHPHGLLGRGRGPTAAHQDALRRAKQTIGWLGDAATAWPPQARNPLPDWGD